MVEDGGFMICVSEFETIGSDETSSCSEVWWWWEFSDELSEVIMAMVFFFSDVE